MKFIKLLILSFSLLILVKCQKEKNHSDVAPQGMVWIPSGSFKEGAVSHDRMALPREKPNFKVRLDGFFMDITEVTNAQFSKFVEETGYITLAERPIDWEEMKKELPEGTPKPADSLLQPGSLTFHKTSDPNVALSDYHIWWKWTLGANWKHPNGPKSSIVGKDEHPVVHIAYEDAVAYCKWSGRRLPTEAEWEYAARGGLEGMIYFWGNDMSLLPEKANTWNGTFPYKNTMEDNFERTAPVKQYPANGFGLYDMAGNVWEWTSDWYHEHRSHEMIRSKNAVLNPKATFNKNQNPNIKEKVIKGGSFLCHESYCASYRTSSRMNSSINSSAEHIGFRTVVTIDMLQHKK